MKLRGSGLTTIPISRASEDALADVFFIHGLAGDPVATWQSDAKQPEHAWPNWLAEDLTTISVWILGYPAEKLGGRRARAMSIEDRAKSLVENLSSRDFGKRPIIFIAHSLGGLLIKQMLLIGEDNARWCKVTRAVRGVVFLATPHSGVKLAAVANALALILGPSVATIDLDQDSAKLLELRELYAIYANQRAIKTASYAETRPLRVQGLKTCIVVSKESAWAGCDRTIPIDDVDHIEIARPRSREADIYVSVLSNLREWLKTITRVPEIRTFFDHLIKYHTKLFAGRDDEIEQILSFVRCSRTGYIFIEAPSGYGKTSLLAHLVNNKVNNNVNFVYHFISQRYKTSNSAFDPTQLDALLVNLCEQLTPEPLASIDNIALQIKFQKLLSAPPTKPTVLVIDAVDEVDRNPNFLHGILPAQLPEGLIIILSARTLGDRSYLSDIGVKREEVALHITLPGLNEATIGKLLICLESPANQLAKDTEFIKQLRHISGGDPFYLRFLIEDIATEKLTRKNIDNTPTGLVGYLDQQLEHLSRNAHLPQHLEILAQLLDHDEALSRADLIGMVPGLNWINFGAVVADIHRFLLVRDNEYTFCHDRFKQYILEQKRNAKIHC